MYGVGDISDPSLLVNWLSPLLCDRKNLESHILAIVLYALEYRETNPSVNTTYNPDSS